MALLFTHWVILAIFFSFFLTQSQSPMDSNFEIAITCIHFCPSALSQPYPKSALSLSWTTAVVFKLYPCFPSYYLLRSPFTEKMNSFCCILTWHPYVFGFFFFFMKNFPIIFFYTCSLIIIFANYKISLYHWMILFLKPRTMIVHW